MPASSSSKIKHFGQSQKPRRRWGRIILLSLAGLLLVGAILIALAPTLLSTSAGVSLVNSFLNTDPARPIVVTDLDLRWSGTQRITGLTVGDGHGGTLAKIDATLDGSLLSWARGSRDFGTVTLSGSVNLASAPASSAPATPPTSSPTPPLKLPSDLIATLKLDKLSVTYTDPLLAPGSAAAGTASFDNLTGTVALNVPDRKPLAIDLKGATSLAGKPGSLTLVGTITDLVASDGTLTLDKAGGKVSGAFNDLPSALVDALAHLDGKLTRTLGDTFTLGIDADGTLKAGSASLGLTAPNAQASASLAVADGVLTATRPVSVMLRVAPATLAAWLPPDQADRIALADSGNATLTMSRLELPIPIGGKLNLAAAKLEGNLSLSPNMFTFASPDVPPLRFDALTASVTSEDLTRSIAVKVDGQLAPTDSSRTSPLSVDLTLSNPLTPSGSLAADTLSISGSVTAGEIPTPLIDTLAKQDGLLTDALGMTIRSLKVTADVTGSGSSQATDWTLDLQSDTLISRAAGRLESGRLTLDASGASARLFPTNALLARANSSLGSAASLTTAGEVNLAISHLALTLPKDNASPLAGLQFTGSLSAADLSLHLSSSSESSAPSVLDLPSARCDFSTDDLSKSLTVNTDAGARLNNAAFTVNAQASLTSLLDPAARAASVSLSLPELPVALAQPYVAEKFNLVREALGPALDLSVTARWAASGTTAGSIAARNQRVNADAEFSLSPSSLTLSAKGTQLLTPRLVELARPADSAYALAQPATLAWQLAPATITPPKTDAGSLDWAEGFNSASFSLDASCPELTLSGLPSLVAPLRVSDLKSQTHLAAGASGPISITLSSLLAAAPLTGDSLSIGPVTASASLNTTASQPLQAAQISAPALNVTALESLLGKESGSLSGLVGASGKLTASLKPLPSSQPRPGARAPDADFSLNATFDQLSASLVGSIKDDLLSLSQPGSFSTTISRSYLESALNASASTTADSTPAQPAKPSGAKNNGNTKPAPSPASKPRASFTVPADVKLTGKLSRLTIPLQMFSADQSAAIWSPNQLAAEGALSLSTLSLRSASSPGVDLQNVALTLTGPNLAQGITYSLTGKALPFDQSAKSAATPGDVNFTGVFQSSLPDLKQISLNAAGKLEKFPTVIIDSLAQQNGLLTGVLGPTLDLSLNARNLSMTGGTADLKLTSEHSDAVAPSIEIRDGRALITAQADASLDVTEAVTRGVLKNVNPMLYDVQKKEGPIRLTVRSFAYPLDGDLSKMDGDFTLDLGQVDVPAQGLLGTLLGDMAKGQPETTKASIPPINVTVKKGILAYDQFSVQTAAFDIKTSGRVNLVRKELDLIAVVPLLGWQSALGDIVKISLSDKDLLELPFYLKITGPIDDPKVKPDPDGVRKVTDDLLKKGLLGPLENIGDLFKKKDK